MAMTFIFHRKILEFTAQPPIRIRTIQIIYFSKNMLWLKNTYIFYIFTIHKPRWTKFWWEWRANELLNTFLLKKPYFFQKHVQIKESSFKKMFMALENSWCIGWQLNVFSKQDLRSNTLLMLTLTSWTFEPDLRILREPGCLEWSLWFWEYISFGVSLTSLVNITCIKLKIHRLYVEKTRLATWPKSTKNPQIKKLAQYFRPKNVDCFQVKNYLNINRFWKNRFFHLLR